MGKDINLVSAGFVKAIFIINGVSLVSGSWFWYKYYFDNTGKGLDDFFYIFSIYSLNSFFAAKATSKRLKTEWKAKYWCFLGSIFTLISTIYVSICLFDGKILMPIALNVMPFVLFVICLLSHKNTKVFEGAILVIFLISLIMSALPILAFLLVVFSIVWLLFYKG